MTRNPTPYRPVKPPMNAGEPIGRISRLKPGSNPSSGPPNTILLSMAQKYVSLVPEPNPGFMPPEGMNLLDRMNRSFGHQASKDAINHMRMIERLLNP